MNRTTESRLRSLWPFAIVTVLCLVLVRNDLPVQAEVQEVTPRRAFQSGSERSLVLLQEIATTLERIDRRLERLENAVLKAGRTGQPASDLQQQQPPTRAGIR